MANLLNFAILALAVAVLASLIHYCLRLKQRGNDTVLAVLSASFFGLLMCEDYLERGGDLVLALTTAFILSISAFSIWRDARRHARDARAALLTEAPQPRCS